MAKFLQTDFDGGLVFFGCDMAIPDNAYQWLINGRTRNGSVDPIPKNLELTDAPAGLKQCIATLGNITILFVAGKAYYRLYGTIQWIQIGSFSMSTTATRYYTAVVPSSTMNFKRTSAANNNALLDIQVFPQAIVAGTPSGLLIQDGTNQPWFIYIDNQTNIPVARETKTYADWDNNVNNNAREYVPIGTFMMFYNKKLYIVSKDKRAILQSVSGRPLDFMVNVDNNGNKNPTESRGDAYTVSFTFDFDEITGIYPVNTPDTFLYTTKKSTRLISLDYDNTLFGEPTYREAAPALSNGGINDKSVLELLGDYIILDRESIVSFNATSQLKIESKNTIFSKMLTLLLEGVVQTAKVCLGRYNDYALISVQTTFGPLLAIFDIVQNLWVSVDITSAFQVKEFAVLDTDTTKQIFCITYNNKVFQLFGNEEETESCMFRTKGFVLKELYEHKCQQLRLTFTGGDVGDTVFITEYVDDQYSWSKEQELRFKQTGILYPVRPPVIMPNESMTAPIVFTEPKGLMGRKINYIIVWSGKGTLQEFELITTEKESASTTQQTSAAAKSLTT